MATTPVADPHCSPECPICFRPIKRYDRAKTLYGVKVCRKCRNAFATRREVAYMVDVVMYWIVRAFVIALLGGVLSLLRPPSATGAASQPVAAQGGPSGIAMMVLIGVLVLLFPFLFALLRDGFRGRSPGKLLLGLQVCDFESREPIGLGQSFKRNLILVIPYFNIIGVVGGAITLMRGQRWGDKWARTQVIWLKHKTKLPFCPDGRYCRCCGYDLTGNTSGRCPECGREVPVPPVEHVDCPKCSYDLTGNASGWCPACGAEVPAVLPTLLPVDEVKSLPG
jgi:uncharacterized RDD family membrane protein YckC